MTNSQLVLSFTDLGCRAVGLSGGKGAGLAVMVQEGMPVPPGFVVTSAAFAAAIDGARLRERCRAGDVLGARRIVAAAEPPAAMVAEHYARLRGAVAVRSSACAEDSEAASYAGQQSTYLNVEGLPAVLAKIVECWLSFFSDRAVFYRAEKGSMDDIAMAVVVQQMVDSKKSGVLFTVDPVHGRKDRIVVEAAFGLGENVVDGEHTPDHYALDRKGTLKRSTIVGTRVLDEVELKRLAEMGRKLEEMHGCPQDIEWAFDRSGELFLLQSRPITTI
jgi:pyruvate, water dikinase